MKFADQLYVGFSRRKDGGKGLLGFATMYHPTTKAFEKRKETIERWRDKTIETKIINNEPTFGFTLKNVVGRYSTSNKLFRVYDPRGFELEISADNLMEIIESTSINKGVIADEMVWGNNAGRLVSASSQEYLDHLDPTKKIKPKHEIGDVLVDQVGSRYTVFLGKFHYSVVKGDTEYDYGNSHWGYYNYSNRPHKIHRTAILEKRSKTPMFIYAHFDVNRGDISKKYNLEFRKSFIPDLISSNKVIKVGEPQFDKWYNGSNIISLIVGWRSNYCKLWKTKKEADEYNPTLEQIHEDIPNMEYRYFRTNGYTTLTPVKFINENLSENYM